MLRGRLAAELESIWNFKILFGVRIRFKVRLKSVLVQIKIRHIIIINEVRVRG